MTETDPLVGITPHSFYHLRAGERKAISAAAQSPDGRRSVELMLVDFLRDLADSADPDFERSFIVGREMKDAWPKTFAKDLLDHLQESYPGRVTSAFVDGFGSLDHERSGNHDTRPPSLYRLNSILTLIKTGGVSTASRAARHLMASHLSYTERTGFSKFLAQATIRLAAALIKRPVHERFEGGALAQTFLRDAIRWEPWNPRLWQLWSESYSAQGGAEPAELILWEAVRRFPDNPAPMDQLVRLIGRQSTRLEEALALAQNALLRFPANTYLENAAAVYLLRTGHPDAALELAVESLKRNRASDQNITVLASAINALSVIRKDLGIDVFERLAKLPSDALLLGKVGRALRQQTLNIQWLISYYRFALSRRPENEFLKLALVSTLLETSDAGARLEAQSILHDVLEENPDNAYGLRLVSIMDQGLGAIEGDVTLDQPVEFEVTSFGAIDGAREEGVTVSDMAGPSEAPWPKLPDTVERLGRARRLRSRLDAANDNIRNAAVDELTQFLRHDPTFAYAQLLAVRHELWGKQSKALNTFAAAFESAINTKDMRQLRLLEKSYPKWQALTLVARAVFGDADAKTAARSAVESGQTRTEIESRAFSLIEALDTSNPVRSGSKTIQPTMLERLRELNEWALGEAMPLAA